MPPNRTGSSQETDETLLCVPALQGLKGKFFENLIQVLPPSSRLAAESSFSLVN
jgi:hypothetical protein